MTIAYGLVARGPAVLAEFSAASGNANSVARKILEKLPASGDSRVSYTQDRHVFHIMKSDGLTFVCMADDVSGRRIPFAFLEDIQLRFTKTYGRAAQTALAYAMNDEFSRILHQQMDYFSKNPKADTINRLKGDMAEVRAVMVENIDKVLDRGEKIELLVDKTSEIQDNSLRFKKQSRKLRQSTWVKNVKLFASLICVILILIWLLITFICGGIFLRGCRS